VLRLKGKGAARADKSHGDEYVTLKIVLPEKLDRRSRNSRSAGRPARSRIPAGIWRPDMIKVQEF